MTADRAKPSTRGHRIFPSRGKHHASAFNRAVKSAKSAQRFCFPSMRLFVQRGHSIWSAVRRTDSFGPQRKILERCASGRINGGLSGQASCGPLVNVSMPLIPSWTKSRRKSGRGYPSLSRRLRDAFLECGILAHAFCARACAESRP